MCLSIWQYRPSSRAGKKQVVLKKVLGVFKVFLYEDRTRKYDPEEAHEKHPIHGIPYLTKDKSEGEHQAHVKNEHEIDESHKSQLKF